MNQFLLEDLAHEMWLNPPQTEREANRWLRKAVEKAAVDRKAAIERLYEHTRKAEQRDRASLDAKNWNGSLMPLIPEDVLRRHCAAVVDVVIGEHCGMCHHIAAVYLGRHGIHCDVHANSKCPLCEEAK